MKRYATMLLGLLLSLLIVGQAQAQTEVTVRQINEIRQTAVDSLNAGGAALDGALIGPLTASAFTNQEVSIVAVVLSNPRTSGLGNPDADGFPSRIHVYVRDTSAVTMGNEGMGIQLVDGAYQDTGLLNNAIGDVIRVVGVPSAFTGSGGASQQLSPTSIEVLGSMADFNLPASLLDPVVITTDMANKSVGSNGEVQVNWSNLASLNGQYVRLEGATIQVRDISSDRPNWLITTDGGTTVFGVFGQERRQRHRPGQQLGEQPQAIEQPLFLGQGRQRRHHRHPLLLELQQQPQLPLGSLRVQVALA